MSFEIAKAGWLHRQSSVLRRWKRNWFVLYTDGMLKYFDSPNDYVAKEAELIPTKLRHIKIGKEVTGVTPPPGFTSECLITLNFGDENWTLCAESVDDMRAWQLSLEEARLVRAAGHAAPPPYAAAAQPAYPGQVYPAQMYVGPTGQTTYTYYGNHPPPYVVQSPPGQTTVIYADAPGPYYYRRGYDGTDVAMGVVAGAALGSMMWGPLMWW